MSHLISCGDDPVRWWQMTNRRFAQLQPHLLAAAGGDAALVHELALAYAVNGLALDQLAARDRPLALRVLDLLARCAQAPPDTYWVREFNAGLDPAQTAESLAHLRQLGARVQEWRERLAAG